jgi:hypothetical protein
MVFQEFLIYLCKIQVIINFVEFIVNDFCMLRLGMRSWREQEGALRGRNE